MHAVGLRDEESDTNVQVFRRFTRGFLREAVNWHPRTGTTVPQVGDTLALWASIVSVFGTVIALFALAVAYLDWRQVGMESPWKFTAVGGGF